MIVTLLNMTLRLQAARDCDLTQQDRGAGYRQHMVVTLRNRTKEQVTYRLHGVARTIVTLLKRTGEHVTGNIRS